MFTLVAAAFLLDAVQGAWLLSGQPTTTQHIVVDDIDSAIPFLDSCLLTDAGADLSAPCSGLGAGDAVTVQVLQTPRNTVFGVTPARILDPPGHDTTTRSIVLLGLATVVCLGILLATLISRLWPVWAQARAVKRAREVGCDLRYARVQNVGDEVLLLFPLIGDVGPRWAVELPDPLPADIPMTGKLRLAGPVQLGGGTPVPDSWAVPIIAEWPLWGAGLLCEVEPDDLPDLLRGPGEILADLADADGEDGPNR